MSAFNVSDRHIAALATYAAGERDLRYYFGGEWRPMDDMQKIGSILREANNASMVARYGQGEGAVAYKHRAFLGRLPHADCYRACECFDYQACEYDGWSESEAKAIVDTIKNHAAWKMSELSSDTWDITDRWTPGLSRKRA